MSPATRVLALAVVLLTLATLAPAALSNEQQAGAYLPYVRSPEADETPTPGPPPKCVTCSSDYHNCGDFDTQSEAQACHDYCFELTGRDVHGLDGKDNDGRACEHLPISSQNGP
jgi:hypothetical protein